MSLPSLFVDRLKQILPPNKCESTLLSFEKESGLSLRINSLKVSREEALSYLKDQNISFHEYEDYKDAFYIKNKSRLNLRDDPWVLDGKMYIQDYSSMIPVLVLDPKLNESILDFCASPGSKTTQIASLVNNEAKLVAIEKVRDRYYRLRSNCERLGASCVKSICLDARKFKSDDLFDKILVDAPCSSEARFKAFDKKSVGYWSLRKIKEMSKKQKGLLFSAYKLLKKGGSMVYSTCTFSPEENEACVSWLLKKTEGKLKLQKINFSSINSYPAILKWNKKEFSPEVEKCLRILPTDRNEAFFIAKFVLE